VRPSSLDSSSVHRPQLKPSHGICLFTTTTVIFEFVVTLYYGRDKDMIRLPRKFAVVVDEKTNQVLMRVHGGATGYRLLDRGSPV
jgi:hypothetical protein